MSKTVLIIDDDDILRKALARGLRTSGFNVLASNSAENAIEVLARTTVDALILDRMMTGMDGLTLLKKLRRDGNTTPTIMLTAMTGAENAIDRDLLHPRPCQPYRQKYKWYCYLRQNG